MFTLSGTLWCVLHFLHTRHHIHLKPTATAVLFFFLPGNSWFGIILPSSTAVNVILSLLITLRTARLQREHRRVLGILKEDPDSTPYSRISELCLESSSLMILFGLTLTIMLARTKSGSEALRAGGWILVPLMVFPHICVGPWYF